jgi:hypothetical protein
MKNGKKSAQNAVAILSSARVSKTAANSGNVSAAISISADAVGPLLPMW